MDNGNLENFYYDECGNLCIVMSTGSTASFSSMTAAPECGEVISEDFPYTDEGFLRACGIEL